MNGGTFINTVDHLGLQSYQWDKQGLQHNYYYETIADAPLDRTMLGIYQEPNDYQDFHLPRTTPTPTDFVLPAKCAKSNYCSVISLCTLVREGVSS